MSTPYPPQPGQQPPREQPGGQPYGYEQGQPAGQQYGPPSGGVPAPGQPMPGQPMPGQQAPGLQAQQPGGFPPQGQAPAGAFGGQAQAPYGPPQQGPYGGQPAPMGQQQPGFGDPYGRPYAHPGGYAQPPYSEVPPGMPPGVPGEYTQLGTGVPVKLASLGSRFLARLLDGLIIGVPMTIVLMIISFAMAPSPEDIARGETSGFGFVGVMMLMPVLMAVAYVVYEALMIGPRGQTIGKQVVGVKVVLAATGQVPGSGKAAGRSGVMFGPYAIPFIGGMYLLLCYLSPLFDSARRQGWHDKAVQTIAIATK